MENWVYLIGGSIGSVGAFWIIISYVLSRLDGKLDIKVFDQFDLRIEASLLSGNKRFDRLESALKENTAMLTKLCGEIGELKGLVRKE